MIISKHVRQFAAALLVAAASAASAWAGEFYEKEGAAIRGYDPMAYFTESKPVKGSPAHKAEYKGSVFHFASRANRDAFAADPAKYAPQYNGFCAFGTAGGYKAAVDPAAFTIVGGKLYLNYNIEVRRQWSAGYPGLRLESRQELARRGETNQSPRVASHTFCFAREAEEVAMRAAHRGSGPVKQRGIALPPPSRADARPTSAFAGEERGSATFRR